MLATTAPVGGRVHAMKEGQQTIKVKTFGLALFLCGRGFRALGADGDEFIFPAEAAGEMAMYRWHKEALCALQKEIRGR